MSHSLRLTDTQKQQRDSLYFERRRSPRRRARGKVTAVCRDSRAPDTPQRLCTLELTDLSNSGVGAIAQEPLSVGTQITVFFPPHGSEPGFDLIGEVVRCRSIDDSHEIGIALSESAKLAG